MINKNTIIENVFKEFRLKEDIDAVKKLTSNVNNHKHEIINNNNLPIQKPNVGTVSEIISKLEIRNFNHKNLNNTFSVNDFSGTLVATKANGLWSLHPGMNYYFYNTKTNIYNLAPVEKTQLVAFLNKVISNPNKTFFAEDKILETIVDHALLLVKDAEPFKKELDHNHICIRYLGKEPDNYSRKMFGVHYHNQSLVLKEKIKDPITGLMTKWKSSNIDQYSDIIAFKGKEGVWYWSSSVRSWIKKKLEIYGSNDNVREKCKDNIISKIYYNHRPYLKKEIEK